MSTPPRRRTWSREAAPVWWAVRPLEHLRCSTSVWADHRPRLTDCWVRCSTCVPSRTTCSCWGFPTRSRRRHARSDSTRWPLTSIAIGDASQPSSNRARLALLARCEALADEVDAERHFRDAVELSDALSPFDRARTELLYGEWLRRQRRRTDARPRLRTALDQFAQLGARPWETRARSELRASGETARRRDPSTRDQLTPQELQIARLVASGMSNPEVAGQLFLSPRTIDYHLRKVFAKLEITSRAELARMSLGELHTV